ncbi:protein dead ringer isoform X2 [Coccinella septempunctata]|uniref:protein dead ringer isoform X2 n=1 Tax=Coccinella septempunctata TaxID=41139 RepID=UPI001D08D118|nr:protein dead ringer isoform X2 [Coccinella septempunctata]
MDMEQQERESEMGEESPMSHNEDEISDGDDSMRDNEDGDSCEENRMPHNSMLPEHGDVLAKLKMQVGSIKPGEFDMRQLERQLNFTNMAQFQERFQVPAPFPFPHPAAAFLPPMTQPQAAQPPSSASSHSSEGSASSQTTWSFEEQFKQVRQLYEINDDPKRKEFLDDLFSFMQKRGTPINRLPIMAKSVLDLYELYNLVIARGGLVDVINKKLWQEIIKGLHLPSSITSAAFTLRTQYMKYLYPYECEKQNLSSPSELQAAIDGNRREGRRSGYSQYEVMSRSPNPNTLNSMAQISQMQQMQLNRMTTAMAAQEHSIVASLMEYGGRTNPSNGVHKVNATDTGIGIPNGVHPSHPQPMSQPSNGGPLPGLAPNELEARMMKYMEYLNKEMRNNSAAAQVALPQVRNNISPPNPTAQTMHPYDISTRMALWNIYNNNQAPAEPQKEALNLANGTPVPRSPVIKEEPEESRDEVVPSPKKIRREESETSCNTIPSTATNIKIDTRGNANGESSMVVSMEFNGIKYQGVLFAQNTRTTDNRTPITS